MKILFDGEKRTVSALNKVKKDARKEVNKLIANALFRTTTRAKKELNYTGNDRKLATDVTGVKQSINFTLDPANLSGKVFAGNTTGDHLAAYLDFGTGKYAARYVSTLPPEFQALAMTFFKTGKGTLKSYAYLSSSYILEKNRMVEKFKGLKLGW